MDTADFIDALEFEDQLVFDENIDSIATVQTDTFVLDQQRMFELEADSVQRPLPGKALLIGRFEQPRAKDPMNFDRTANDSIRKVGSSLFMPFMFFMVDPPSASSARMVVAHKFVAHPWMPPEPRGYDVETMARVTLQGC